MQVKQVLHIVAGYKNSKTFLKHSYAAQPFKIANISENKSQNLLRLMMTSSLSTRRLFLTRRTFI